MALRGPVEEGDLDQPDGVPVGLLHQGGGKVSTVRGASWVHGTGIEIK